jgi:hypothetical protein
VLRQLLGGGFKPNCEFRMICQLFAKSEPIEFCLGFGIEGVHEKASGGFGAIFLFTANAGVGEVYFVPELFSGHPFSAIPHYGKLLGAIAGGDNETLMEFSEVVAEVGAGFFDEGVSGFVGVGVVDGQEVGDGFFGGRGVAILGVKDELCIEGVVGSISGEVVDEGAPCFFESGLIANLFEVVPSSDNVIAINEKECVGSGVGFHGFFGMVRVSRGRSSLYRLYDDTVVSILSRIIVSRG